MNLKRTKKLMCALFAVMVSMSINAQTTSGDCGYPNAADVQWSYEGTTLKLTGAGAMADFAYGEAPWSNFADQMKYVEIEEGVTSVGNQAFAGFEALRSVTFPSNGFTRIGEYAFSGCISYKNLNLPTSLTTIETGAFSGSAVRGAYIPGGVKKIGDYAFENCTNLDGASLFEGIEEIGENAFDGCALISVGIPSTVTTIGTGAFMYNTELEEVYIGVGVTAIGDCAFQGCTALKYVGLGVATTPTLGDAVFTGDDAVTPLDIEAFLVPSTTPYTGGWGGFAADKFKTLYEGTWTYHDNNTDTDDPEKGTGTWSFNVANGTLTVNGTGNLNVSPWMGMASVNPTLYDDEHPGYWSKVLSFVVGEGITHLQTLGVGMQINCASVTLPSTLKYVGYSCLEECAFTSIELPEGLETIDDYTFFDSKLTSLTIPSTVTYIGSSAFLANENLTTITCLPTTPPDLGEYEPCFGDGSTITAIYVPASSVDAYKNWEWDESVTSPGWTGWKAYADKIVAGGAPATTTTFAYTASEQVTKFDTYANFTGATSVKSHTFADGAGTVVYEGTVTGLGLRALNATNLTAIIIPESVTTLGERAFTDCSKLVSITFDGTPAIKTIGDYAFAGCKALTAFDMPSTVTALGNSAFSNSKELTAITIPEGVTTIGEYTFRGCEKLETVTFAGTPTVTALGSSAFGGCKVLAAIAIPATVETIGDGAFTGCTALASVTFTGTSVLTTIGTSAFSSCSSLTTITLPESVTTLGAIQTVGDETYYNNSVFWGSGLTSFVLPKNVTTIYGGGMFANCPLTSLTVDAANTNYADLGCNAIFEKTTDKLVVGCVATTVPDGTKVIGREAFFAEEQPFTITLPESVTAIEDRAFHMARGLKSITIPSQVTHIDEETFLFCESTTDVYCYVNPANMLWDGFNWAFDMMNEKATKFHVKEDALAAWEAKYPDANVTFVGDLTDYVLGDVNGDGVVDISDYIGVANHILGNTPAGFDMDAADVNNDGEIDISDYIGVANIILTGKP